MLTPSRAVLCPSCGLAAVHGSVEACVRSLKVALSRARASNPTGAAQWAALQAQRDRDGLRLRGRR